MTDRRITFNDVFNSLLTDISSTFTNGSVFQTSNLKYPPCNIEKSSENNLTIKFAVAGFSEDQIDVTFENGILSITGSQDEQRDTAIGNPVLLYKGISGRSFKQSFRVDTNFEINAIELENGILSVNLTREILEPVSSKYSIGYKKLQPLNG